MKTNQTLFYLLTVALFLCLVSPSLLSEGMFLDGVTYAAIAKNLADGLGTFWDLHYTNTLYPHFHEHPPLAMGIQSLFFKLFGSGYLVERIYSLTTFFLTGCILAITWRRLPGVKWPKLGWLPILFWIFIPLVSWAVSNNLLENTLMVFVSLAVYMIFESMRNHRLLYVCLAGLALFLGALTKGFVALFPITLPAWIWIFSAGYSFGRAVADTMILLLMMLVGFLVIFITMPESIESLKAYLDSQVLNSIRNIRTVDNRFYILWRMFLELVPGLLLILILHFFIQKNILKKSSARTFYLLFALGLSGVLPIMISLKQSGFYIQATFPVFSLGLAYLSAPHIQQLVDRMEIRSRGYEIFRYGAILLLVVGLFLNSVHINRVGRDHQMIADIQRMMEIVPSGSNVEVTGELWEDWALHAYFQRYAGISLDQQQPISAPYFLISKGADGDIPSGYTKTPIKLSGFDLYAKPVITVGH